MILLAEHDEPLLAAKKKRQVAASESLTSTPKNRVWGFENTPSGRPSVESQLSWENATGSVQYTYQIASGRAEWLSRDPLGEGIGPNLYGYVSNNPIYWVDPLGLSTMPSGLSGIGGLMHEAYEGTASALSAISDALTNFENSVDSAEGTDSNNYANQLAAGALGGFPGDANWRNLLKQIKQRGRGNIDCSKSGVPTEAQARQLIDQAKGKVLRGPEQHEPPNPHTYPHLNFENADGDLKTIEVTPPAP